MRGTGKTATMMHCVHWARSQGWLVLHVPKASEVMFGGWWVEPSREVDGDFDQPQVDAATRTWTKEEKTTLTACDFLFPPATFPLLTSTWRFYIYPFFSSRGFGWLFLMFSVSSHTICAIGNRWLPKF